MYLLKYKIYIVKEVIDFSPNTHYNLPQLDITTYMSQVFYLIYFLLATYFILSFYIFQKIIITLKFYIKKIKLIFNNIMYKIYKRNSLGVLIEKNIETNIKNILNNIKNRLLIKKIVIYKYNIEI